MRSEWPSLKPSNLTISCPESGFVRHASERLQHPWQILPVNQQTTALCRSLYQRCIVRVSNDSESWRFCPTARYISIGTNARIGSSYLSSERVAARELDLQHAFAIAVLQALRDVIKEMSEIDPYFEDIRNARHQPPETGE